MKDRAVQSLLSEAGVLDDAGALRRTLEGLAPLVPDDAPVPSPRLAAALAGTAPVRRPHHRFRFAVAGGALAAGVAVGLGGLAAANELPDGAQRAVAQWSERHLPFQFPEPTTSTPAPGTDSHTDSPTDSPTGSSSSAPTAPTTSPHGSSSPGASVDEPSPSGGAASSPAGAGASRSGGPRTSGAATPSGTPSPTSQPSATPEPSATESPSPSGEASSSAPASSPPPSPSEPPSATTSESPTPQE